MKYYVYINEPGAEMHIIEGNSKNEVLKKYNDLMNANYKFVAKDKAMGHDRIEVVSVSDYRHYNFSKFSYAVNK